MKVITIKDKRFKGDKALVMKIKQTSSGYDITVNSILDGILNFIIDGKKILPCKKLKPN